MVDFKSDNNEISARCGGWCGACEPETDIWLVPIGTPMIRGQKVEKNKIIQGTLRKYFTRNG